MSHAHYPGLFIQEGLEQWAYKNNAWGLFFSLPLNDKVVYMIKGCYAVYGLEWVFFLSGFEPQLCFKLYANGSSIRMGCICELSCV